MFFLIEKLKLKIEKWWQYNDVLAHLGSVNTYKLVYFH